MGAALSINRKELFRDCSIWNIKPRENAKTFYCKCCYHVSGECNKENKVTSFISCDGLAAYLQKCASVGKKKMRSKIEPVVAGNKYITRDSKEKGGDDLKAKITVKTERSEDLQHKSKSTERACSALNENQAPSATKPPQKSSSSFTLSSDALKCVGNFVKSRCKSLNRLRASEVVLWMRGVDRALLLQGWQDQAFLTPPNLVFLYMLLKDSLTEKCTSVAQARAEVLTCLYMAYTYSGPEISYPLKPFLVDGNRDAFWDRCVSITNNLSGKMLKTNRDPRYFGELLVELKQFSPVVDRRDG